MKSAILVILCWVVAVIGWQTLQTYRQAAKQETPFETTTRIMNGDSSGLSKELGQSPAEIAFKPLLSPMIMFMIADVFLGNWGKMLGCVLLVWGWTWLRRQREGASYG